MQKELETKIAHSKSRNGRNAENVPISPRWTWHYRTLLELRDRVIGDREMNISNAREAQANSAEIADRATDEFNQGLALSQLSAEQNALYEIEEAIRRISDGSYGICEVSGRRIPSERLRAIPWTRFTKDEAAKLEKNGQTSRVKLGVARSVKDLSELSH